MSVHPIGQQISAAYEELFATGDSGQSLEVRFNSVLNRFLPPRFRAMPGLSVDAKGNSTPEFGSVVYDTTRFDGGGPLIPADAVAAVFDVYERLDQASLGQAYARLSAAKRLEKSEEGVRSPVGGERRSDAFYATCSIESA